MWTVSKINSLGYVNVSEILDGNDTSQLVFHRATLETVQGDKGIGYVPIYKVSYVNGLGKQMSYYSIYADAGMQEFEHVVTEEVLVTVSEANALLNVAAHETVCRDCGENMGKITTEAKTCFVCWASGFSKND